MSGMIMKESGKGLVEVFVVRRAGRDIGGEESDVRLKGRSGCG